MTIRISIDNLTVNGRIKGDLEGFIRSEVALDREGFAVYPYRKRYHFVDGSVLEVAEIDAVRGGKIKDLRYEFNPNKSRGSEQVDQLHKRVLGIMYDVHITRIDVAIDTNIDMRDWKWIDRKGRPNSQYRAGNGELETWYIGGKASHLKFRIYNKAKEQGDAYRDKETPWWRVEVQMRGAMAQTWYDRKYNPFEGITAVREGNFPELPIKDRAMVEYLLRNPDGLSELAKATRSKYRKLLSVVASWECEDMYRIWEEKERDAWASVHSYITTCDNELLS